MWLDVNVDGANVTKIEKIWDQTYNSTFYCGHKNIVINTNSDPDLAL